MGAWCTPSCHGCLVYTLPWVPGVHPPAMDACGTPSCHGCLWYTLLPCHRWYTCHATIGYTPAMPPLVQRMPSDPCFGPENDTFLWIFWDSDTLGTPSSPFVLDFDLILVRGCQRVPGPVPEMCQPGHTREATHCRLCWILT